MHCCRVLTLALARLSCYIYITHNDFSSRKLVNRFSPDSPKPDSPKP